MLPADKKSTSSGRRVNFFIGEIRQHQIIRELDKERILGECLMISSLPDKASRTRVDITRLAEI